MGERAARRALEAAGAVERVGALDRGVAPSTVVILATGAARLLTEALGAAALVPLAGFADELPAYLGRATLVLALERPHERVEPELLRAARGRGARVVRIGPAPPSIPDGVEQVTLEIEPGGISLCSLAAGALALLGSAGVLAQGDGAARDFLHGVRAAGVRRDSGELATAIGRTFPYLWGRDGAAAAAAACWQAEIAQRTKAPAFSARLPGATFVEVAAFGLSGDVTRQLLTLVELRASGEPQAARRRTAATIELLRETLAGVVTVEARGDALSAFGELLGLGEEVAVALALAEGVDPDTVAAAEDLDRLLGSA